MLFLVEQLHEHACAECPRASGRCEVGRSLTSSAVMLQICQKLISASLSHNWKDAHAQVRAHALPSRFCL